MCVCAPHLLPEVKELCPQGCRRRTIRSFQVPVFVEMRGPGDMLLEEHGGFLRGRGLDRRGRPLHAKCSAPWTPGPVLRSPVCSEPSSGLLVECIHLRRIQLLTLRRWGCWPQGPKTVWTQLVSARGLGYGERWVGEMGGTCVVRRGHALRVVAHTQQGGLTLLHVGQVCLVSGVRDS